MAPPLSSEQLDALALDTAALAAARPLATARAWHTLGCAALAAWGEYKGSAREPYRVQLDMRGTEIGFRCSCPSRKQPCKHVLGLLLQLIDNAEALPVLEPPPWVSDWLAARARAAERRAEPQANSGDQEASPPRRNAKAVSGPTAREARVAAGMSELELWLEDGVRGGLVALQAEAPAAFERVAARMVDAQAPGAARQLRAAGEAALSGPGWQGRLLERLARLRLLARAYARVTTLPPALQADVRTTIGFTQSQEELLAEPGLRDRWLVLGRQLEEEDRLRVQRTWLWGAATGRPALLLEFSAAGQPLDRNLVPGSSVDAELVFYPGGAPIRALVRAHHGVAAPVVLPEAPLHEATAAYAAALAVNPWLGRFPLVAGPCTLRRDVGGWHVGDERGDQLPLTRRFDSAWRLLAVTGGRPFRLAGVWDGEGLQPLCAQQRAETILLAQ